MKTWLVRKQIVLMHYVKAETRAQAEVQAEELGEVDTETLSSKWCAQPITNPKHPQYTS